MKKITTQKQIIALSKKLIKILSIDGRIDEQMACLEQLISVFGNDFHVKKYEFGGNPALVLSTTKRKKVDLIVSGHMDVVPGGVSLFKPEEKGTKLFGRGAYDMKVALVASIFAVRDYRKNGGDKEIAIFITTDEEVSGYGTQMLLEKEKYQADFAFIPDGGHDTGIVLNQKGFIQLKVTLEGKSVHAMEQWKGKNPLSKISPLNQCIENAFPGPTEDDQWKTSIVNTKIETTNSLNQIPEEAIVYFDIRYIDPADVKKIIKLIKKEIGEKSTIDVVAENGMFFSEQKNPYVQILAKVISEHVKKEISFVRENGTSDAVFFTERGIPASLFRPKGGNPHQNGEWVDMNSVYSLYCILSEFFERS